jgi:hypothetical protein
MGNSHPLEETSPPFDFVDWGDDLKPPFWGEIGLRAAFLYKRRHSSILYSSWHFSDLRLSNRETILPDLLVIWW